MKRSMIGIIFGGRSTEYEVSLSSAAAVIDSLDRHSYEIVKIGITRQGEWYRYGGDSSAIREDRWRSHPSCVPVVLSANRAFPGLIELAGTEFRFTPLDALFPVMHGKNGEDGTMQGLLELSGIPFVGCGMLSSAVCMDKTMAKIIVQSDGINVPPSVSAIAGDSMEDIVAAAEQLGYPLYVKPSRSGSSIGITKAHGRDELLAGIGKAWAHDSRLVIERHIEGFELGCSVLGHEDPIAGELDEIALHGEFFDHAEKYSLSTASIHLPARIDAGTAREAKEMALRIYRILGCSGLARVDLFLGKDGRLYFNEVNTIPGFTEKSRYPGMMREAGIGFPELLDRLIHDALKEPRI